MSGSTYPMAAHIIHLEQGKPYVKSISTFVDSEAHGHTFILFLEILTRFLARLLTRFLARFLARNTVYSTTGAEKYSVQYYSDGKIYRAVLFQTKKLINFVYPLCELLSYWGSYVLLCFATFCYVLLCFDLFCYVLLCLCYVFVMFCYAFRMFCYVLLRFSSLQPSRKVPNKQPRRTSWR